ncbi:MAG: magnesium chelatase subunit D [Nereida ignava]
MTSPAPAWSVAERALTLLALNPRLGGIWVKARNGPVRDRFNAACDALPLPCRRIHPRVSDEQLFGGVDISATLQKGSIVTEKGLLNDPSTLVLTMAERTEGPLAARLAQTLDAGDHTLIALDEGLDEEGAEQLPPALAERLAFHVDLGGIRHTDVSVITLPSNTDLTTVETPNEVIEYLTSLCIQFGVVGIRAPMFAVEAARTHAALFNRQTPNADDLKAAAELVIAPRATYMPSDQTDAQETPPPPDNTGDNSAANQSAEIIPQDMVIDAIRAMLPPDVLARLAKAKAQRSAKTASGSGDSKKGNRRGRPLPSTTGKLDGTNTIDLVATLRAAAPWQPLRRRGSTRTTLAIRPSDIRVKRFKEMSDRLMIFTVDASGSAAMARLGEAKGAVELLLAQAYARRDHVALVAFRGETAETILQPTRSLVQTKRQLASLAGGGGTPLAAGLKAALDLAQQARGRGLTPTIITLTDGRANIALDGTASRVPAGTDAEMMAQHIAAHNIASMVIDVSNRPHRALETLSSRMMAPYIALPRANAQKLSQAISGAL